MSVYSAGELRTLYSSSASARAVLEEGDQNTGFTLRYTYPSSTMRWNTSVGQFTEIRHKKTHTNNNKVIHVCVCAPADGVSCAGD